MAAVRKCTPTAGPAQCRPKTGQTWCLRAKHADGLRVHKHFSLESEALNLRNQLAGERAGGTRVPGRGSRDTFEAYGERWRDSSGAPGARRRPLRPPAGLQAGREGPGSPLRRPPATEAAEGAPGRLRPLHSRAHPGLRGRRPAPGARRRRLPHRPHRAAHPAPAGPARHHRRHNRRTWCRRGPKRSPSWAPRPPATGSAWPSGSAAVSGSARSSGCAPRMRTCSPGPSPSPSSSNAEGTCRPRHGEACAPSRSPSSSPSSCAGPCGTTRPPACRSWPGPGAGCCAGTAGTSRHGAPPSRAPASTAKRYKFHSTRHYAVSSMLGAGVPLPEVAAYIGDHIETVTRVYAHFLDDAPRTAKSRPRPGPRAGFRPNIRGGDVVTHVGG